MVGLVLQDAGVEAGGLDPDRLAALVLGLDHDVARALHLDVDAGLAERQATLERELALLAALDDPRVHDHARGRVVGVVGQAVDEHPPQRADLRRREPGAVGAHHDLDELGDLLREGFVELLDRPCPLTQDGVSPLADERERAFVGRGHGAAG